jgi:hypothetical protein
MDKVLAFIQAIAESGQDTGNVSRVLTDISGNNFTLVFETKAESLDAYWEGLQAMFEDPGSADQIGPMIQYIESGYREFYTIEYENE